MPQPAHRAKSQVRNPESSFGAVHAWTEGTIAGQDIFRGYVLQCENLFLPATGKLEADLTCEISWLTNDGGGYFDAAGNGRKLSGFGVVIAT